MGEDSTAAVGTETPQALTPGGFAVSPEAREIIRGAVADRLGEVVDWPTQSLVVDMVADLLAAPEVAWKLRDVGGDDPLLRIAGEREVQVYLQGEWITLRSPKMSKITRLQRQLVEITRTDPYGAVSRTMLHTFYALAAAGMGKDFRRRFPKVELTPQEEMALDKQEAYGLDEGETEIVDTSFAGWVDLTDSDLMERAVSRLFPMVEEGDGEKGDDSEESTFPDS